MQSNDPDEAAREAWIRRKSYDPMAAAKSKKGNACKSRKSLTLHQKTCEKESSSSTSPELLKNSGSIIDISPRGRTTLASNWPITKKRSLTRQTTQIIMIILLIFRD